MPTDRARPLRTLDHSHLRGRLGVCSGSARAPAVERDDCDKREELKNDEEMRFHDGYQR